MYKGVWMTTVKPQLCSKHMVTLRQSVSKCPPNYACLLFCPLYETHCKYYCIITWWLSMLTCLSKLQSCMVACIPVAFWLEVTCCQSGCTHRASARTAASLLHLWHEPGLTASHILSSQPSSIHGSDCTTLNTAEPRHWFLASSFVSIFFITRLLMHLRFHNRGRGNRYPVWDEWHTLYIHQGKLHVYIPIWTVNGIHLN